MYIISLAIMSFTTNLFVIGAIIATVYFLLKFLEMRFVDQDNKKPIKVLIRDTLIVGISSVLGVYLLEQFKMFHSGSGSGIGGDGAGASSSPAAFVDTPGF
jgi:RsiW-degrading membrane proteinase PrsW (M82 family)